MRDPGPTLDPLVTFVRLVVWGSAGWLFANGYAAAASRGERGTLLLIVLAGASVGALGSMVAGVGATGAMILAGVRPAVAALWFVPLAIAWILRWVSIYGRHLRTGLTYSANPVSYKLPNIPLKYEPSIRLTHLVNGIVYLLALALVGPLSSAQLLGSFAAYTGAWSILQAVLRQRLDRATAASSLLGIALLLAVGFAVIRSDVTLSPSLLAVLTLASLHLLFLRGVIKLTRYRRHEVDIAMISCVLHAELVAISPVGHAFIGRTERTPVLATVLLLGLPLIFTGCWLAYGKFMSAQFMNVTMPARGRIRILFTSAYPTLLFLPWVSAMSNAQYRQGRTPGLVVFCSTALVLLVYIWLMPRVFDILRRFDAVIFGRMKPLWWDLGRKEEAWERDSLHERDGRSDLSLVVTLATEGLRVAQGMATAPTHILVSKYQKGDVPPASSGVTWVDKAMSLIRSESEHGENESRWKYDVALAYCGWTIGRIYAALGYPEDGAYAFREAADWLRRAALPNAEAFMLVQERTALAETTVAMERLEALTTDRKVAFKIRRHIAALLARKRYDEGRWDLAKKVLDAVSSGPMKDCPSARESISYIGDCITISMNLDDLPLTYVLTTSPEAEAELLASGISAFVPVLPSAQIFIPSILHGGLKVVGRRLIIAAADSIQEGAVDIAASLLEPAAALAKNAGLTVLAIELYEAVGFLLAPTEPERAVRDLELASRFREDVRARFSTFDARLHYSHASTRLHATLIELASALERVQLDGNSLDGPSFALRVIEQAKSRTLVDQFSGGVPLPPVPGLEAVVTAAIALENARDRAHEAWRTWSRARRDHRRDATDDPTQAERSRLDAEVAAAEQTLTESYATSAERGVARSLAEAFVEAATAEHRLASARTALHRSGERGNAIMEVPAARIALEQAWERLSRQGEQAAEYVSLRHGTTLDWQQLKNML